MSVITRKRASGNYVYYKGNTAIKDKAEIVRINSLAVPPAWKNVKISSSRTDKIQATGIDSAGRKQSIYHKDFRLQQEQAKFDKMLTFARKLPKLRKQIEQDLESRELTKEKVTATVIKLIDQAYFRVGNDIYAKTHHTYGITTMRSKHVTVGSTSIMFDFVGKAGKRHKKIIKDAKLTRIIKKLDEQPGYEIFKYIGSDDSWHAISSTDVNMYMHAHMGEEYTAKDFRTWGGTLLAATEILKAKWEGTATTKQKRTLNRIIKKVAKKLGNTPAVAKSSYIDPRILSYAEDTIKLGRLKKSIGAIKPRKYMNADEQALELLLNNYK